METSPCPPKADHGAEELRPPAVGQPVDVEAVVVAGHHHVARKGHVGVGEAQQRRALVLVVFLLFGIPAFLGSCLGRFVPDGVCPQALWR
jgi:hypothetical protein